MQKYIYRYVILFLLITLNCFAQEPKIDMDFFNQTINKNMDFMQKLKEQSSASALKYGTSLFGQNLSSQEPEIKYMDYLFYFFSESMSMKNIENILIQFQRFREINNNSKIYIVLNGLPSKKIMQKFRGLYKDELAGLFKIKVHPSMYSYYNLQSVPAFAMASCPEDFRFKKCLLDKSPLIRGNISLNDFFEILAQKEPEIYERINSQMRNAK